MKDDLQLKLVEILGSIQTAAGKAGDFALSQMPDIAQSYVAFGRVDATVMFLGSFALASSGVGALFWGKRFIAKNPDMPEHHMLGVMAALIFGIAASVIGFVCSANTFTSAALVWFAPKVWLLKELAVMVR